MTAIDFDAVTVLTFDCYGTLIDWETGIISELRKVIPSDGVSDEALLDAYGAEEARLEAGAYVPYREVLRRAMTAVAEASGVEPTIEQARAFESTVVEWPAFRDSVEALARLRTRFRLGVLTNCDDELFAHTNRRLAEPFDWVITAEQLQSYKPNPRNFVQALERIGEPRARVVHVAQSLFHDHAPAQKLGLRTVWINRRHDRPGTGATPAASADPDMTFTDMKSFAAFAVPQGITSRG